MGIHVSIYNAERSGRDALSVIPAAAKGLCIVNASGPFEPSADYPAAKIVPAAGGPGAARCVPLEAFEAGKWLMKGYSFVASSDSRFSECVEKVIGARFYGAVALHDRCEG
jgi:hypothetical protein